MISYPIAVGGDALQALQAIADRPQIMVLVDEHTARDCYPRLVPLLPAHQVCQIPAGESHKNLDTCIRIWEALTVAQFDRHALLINLGGGVIGDMGGFVAGTYKRGIDFIQVPTTLLAQVDASVGSKLGIDFQGYKNHIGLFGDPLGVYIDPTFLRTLPYRELRSGFAEVIKHHLIADAEGWKRLKQITRLEEADFTALIRHSIDIKSRIVESDPREQGPRKSLNFGHTIGHAVESFFLESDTPLLHGEAVALGMIAESFLSAIRGWLSENSLHDIQHFILYHFPLSPISPEHFEPIAALCLNDKKNQAGRILCTLLEEIGHFHINEEISKAEVIEALHYFNTLLPQRSSPTSP